MFATSINYYVCLIANKSTETLAACIMVFLYCTALFLYCRHNTTDSCDCRYYAIL